MSEDQQRVEVEVNPPSGLFYGHVVTVVSSLILVLIFAVHYSFGIFLKPVLTEFGWTRAATSGAFSLVWVVQGMLAFVMGSLNDRMGPRRLVTIAGILIGSGFLLMSGISQMWQLYVLYGVVVGAGLGGTFVPLTSTTARWFVAKRGLMTGIVTAGVGIGAFVGPPIANKLIVAHDWRVSYQIFGSVVLIGVAAAAQLLKRQPSDVGARPYGESLASAAAKNTIAPGLVLGDALRTSQFWIATVAMFGYGVALAAILLHLAPHTSDVGISAATAATILATLGGASVVGKVILGSMCDSLGSKGVCVISFILMVGSLLWLINMKEVWMFFTFASIFGFAYGGLATAFSPLVAWLFGMTQHGRIYGALFNGWTLGCAVGPLAAGYLYDRSHNYEVAFMICAGFAVVGLVMTTLLKPAFVSTPGRPS